MDFAIWNKNHMALPELTCVGRPRGKGVFHAHCTAFERSRILAATERNKLGELAEQTTSERTKKMMFKIADDYDQLAVRAAISLG